MNPGIVENVAAKFSLSTPYQIKNVSWLIVLALTVTSHSGKI